MSRWIRANAVRVRKVGRRTVVDILRGGALTSSGKPSKAAIRRNIEEGWYYGGKFHPSRRSWDYDPSEYAGEGKAWADDEAGRRAEGGTYRRKKAKRRRR